MASPTTAEAGCAECKRLRDILLSHEQPGDDAWPEARRDLGLHRLTHREAK